VNFHDAALIIESSGLSYPQTAGFLFLAFFVRFCKCTGLQEKLSVTRLPHKLASKTPGQTKGGSCMLVSDSDHNSRCVLYRG